MRIGTILRILGLILFIAGIAGGLLIGFGSQVLITAFTTGVSENASAAGFGWVSAIIAWVSAFILSGLIFAVGTMSNNLDQMNAKLDDVQNNTFETAKTLRFIAHAVNVRLPRDAANVEANGTEPSVQRAPRSYGRSRASSTEA